MLGHMNRTSAPVFELTPRQARVLHLAAQGLAHKPRQKATPALVEQTIARMQMLQIDTIHVVARSPYLVLFSRLGDYPMVWLNQLLETGRLAECWAHEASFVSAADYPLHRAARPLRIGHWAARRAQRVYAKHPEAMHELLEHVREHGPMRSADFSRARRQATGWWDWKPEKSWLEAWFALGDLMVTRRDGFQRVYDLSERVRAQHAAAAAPASSEAARRQMLERSVLALGITTIRWIADYFRLARVTRDELDELCATGEVLPVSVRGWDQMAYTHRAHADLIRRIASGRLRASHTTLLSPFDPVIWDRTRVQELFDFEYRLECYVPAARRRYGYFVLPILHRGRLVGRLDAKAHRGEGVFDVRAIYLESGVHASDGLIDAVIRAIRACAQWHSTPRVRVGYGEPQDFLRRLRAGLRRA